MPVLLVLVLAVLMVWVTPAPSPAAPLRNVPQTITQPDGTVIHCFASGDEYYNYLHDAEGYVIVRDALGWYAYAVKQDGHLVPSAAIVGRDGPETLQVQPHLRPSPQVLEQRMAGAREMLPAPAAVKAAPTTGVINNVVIFIRFSDEPEYRDPINVYVSMFNGSGQVNSSMQDYFEEASYGALSVSSSFYPPAQDGIVRSYQDTHSRDYYRLYDAATNPIGYVDVYDRTEREQALLQGACAAVDMDVPGGLTLDNDGDGMVDSVCFIISGSAEGWNELLWPHRSRLFNWPAFLNGKQVWDYAFQIQNWMEAGVLCHEMFHVLGAPDLYHYYDQTDISPVGSWDIMGNTSAIPQHMGCYMKMRYAGWVDSIPKVTSSGTYSLNPLTSADGQCYKIASSDPSQYYVVEYRRKIGSFESSVPGSGLLVYRINTVADGRGNRDLPDEVYLYRPDGTPDENGSLHIAHFSADEGRTAINDMTNPTAFLANGAYGGLDLYGVTEAGGTISFTVDLNGPPETSTAHIAIEHSHIGDLVVRVGVGKPGAPLWSELVFYHEGGGEDALVRDVPLSGAERFLPPSPGNVWFLEVRDELLTDTGRIVGFEVRSGGKTYTARGLPESINDNQTSYAYIGRGTFIGLNLLLQ